MTESVWDPKSPEGVRLLKSPIIGWVISPDDRYIAWWEEAQSGLQMLRCAEIESGREVMRASGKPIGGAVWVSSEALWVVRQELQGLNVIAHAVPDGGVMNARRHLGLQHSRYRVECSLDGNTVLVAPAHWNGGDRKAVRTRPALVLRGPLAELIGTLDIDRVEGFDRKDGGCNGGVAALSPDGEHIAIGYNGSPTPTATGPSGGVAVVRVGGLDPARVPERGAREGFGFDAVDLRWINPERVLLVGGWTRPDKSTDQDVQIVSLAASLRDHPTPVPFAQGAPPARTLSVDLSRDHQRLLLVTPGGGNAVHEVSLETFAQRPLLQRPQLFGARWSSDEGDFVVATLVKQQVCVTTITADQRESVRGVFKLDARQVGALTLDRSPASTHAVVHWEKLGKELQGRRVALVSIT